MVVLIENLVPVVWIEDHSWLIARKLEIVGHSQNTPAVEADGVLRAGDEHDWQILRDLLRPILAADLHQDADNVACAAELEIEAAQWIVDIAVEIFLTGADPVDIGARVLKLGVEYAVADFEEQVRIGVRANFIDNFIEGRYNAFQRSGQLARATKDCAGQFLAKVRGIGTRKEGAHAVPEEEIGQIGIALMHNIVQDVHVVHHADMAVFIVHISKIV